MNTVDVHYKECAHTVRHKSVNVLSKQIESSGRCPRCKNQPLLVYLADAYHIVFPADMQWKGIGAIDVATPYTAQAHVDEVMAAIRGAYPSRHVYLADAITSEQYKSLLHHNYVEERADKVECALMLQEGGTTLVPIVVV